MNFGFTKQNDDNKVKASVEVINPILASMYLDTSKGNRTPRNRNIIKYSKAMAEGRWRLTGQPIIFDEDGCLIDGHHRLKACSIGDAPFTTLVVRGIDRKVMPNIDTHGKRTTSDQLQMEDSDTYGTSAHHVSTIYKRIWCYAKQNLAFTLDDEACMQYIKASNGEWADIPLYKNASKANLNPSCIAAAAYFIRKANAPKSEEFLHKLVTGEMLSATDPIMVLRNRMRLESKRAYSNYNWVISAIIRAYNAWMQGASWKRIELLADTYAEVKF